MRERETAENMNGIPVVQHAGKQIKQVERRYGVKPEKTGVSCHVAPHHPLELVLLVAFKVGRVHREIEEAMAMPVSTAAGRGLGQTVTATLEVSIDPY